MVKSSDGLSGTDYSVYFTYNRAQLKNNLRQKQQRERVKTWKENEKVICSPWNNCDMIDGICSRHTVSDCFSLSPCRRHLDNVLQCAVLITSCTSESSIIFKPGPWQISQSAVRFLRLPLTHTHTHTQAWLSISVQRHCLKLA